MNKKFEKKREYVWVGLLMLLGFAYRIILNLLVPQPFVFDQDQYYGFVLGILKSGLHADAYRLYGYPLIVAPIIALFGVGSPIPWTIFQSGIDVLTGLLVYGIACRLTGDIRIQMGVFVLYLLNPYTSGYAGSLLSEVVTIFLVTLIALLIIHVWEKKNRWVPLLLSFLLGYLPQVRPVFLYLTIIYIGVLVYQFRTQNRLIFLCLVLYITPFTYTIFANSVYFGEASPVSVDRVFPRELYTSQFIGRGLAFTDTQFGVWPAEALRAWSEYSTPGTSLGRKAMAQKYMDLSLTRIRHDPWKFIHMRLEKMWYVWEKHFIFPFVMGPSNWFTKALTYWMNILLLLFAAAGLAFGLGKRESKHLRRFCRYTLFFLLYITVIHSISTAEERFTLPAYPLIILFAAYGFVALIMGKCRMNRSPANRVSERPLEEVHYHR